MFHFKADTPVKIVGLASDDPVNAGEVNCNNDIVACFVIGMFIPVFTVLGGRDCHSPSLSILQKQKEQK